MHSQQTSNAEIFEYFNKLAIDKQFTNYYDCDINEIENYCINQYKDIESVGDDDDLKTLDYFQLFCNMHLKNIEYHNLVENKYFKNVHFSIYSLINNILFRNLSDSENSLIKIFDCL